MYDLRCHNDKIILHLVVILKIYRQQVTLDVDDGSHSPDMLLLSAHILISTDSTADSHFSLHGK